MPDYQPGWHHRVVADAVERMIYGSLRRLIVSMPPRHGKSELISRRLPAFLLGLNPAETVISSSYGADLAGRMNRDIQRVISAPTYNKLFPKTQLSNSNIRTLSGSWLRNSDVFEVVEHGGSYRSTGVGGGITGMGARWLIVDDPLKNREEADSLTMREKVWDWFTSTLYTRQTPDARIIVIMTRWHTDDLAGRLTKLSDETPEGDRWEALNFPAISNDPVVYPDQREPGEALWPEMFPADDLERMRQSIGEYQWQALYQQSPRVGGGVEWPQSYFEKGLMFDEWPEGINLRTIALDPSKGASSRHGDYSAIIKLARTVEGTLWVEADLARRSTEEIVGAMVEAHKDFPAEAVAIETNQFQELLATQIAAAARASGQQMPIVPLVNTVSKAVRIRRLGPYLAAKGIRFRNTPGTRLLMDQLRDFPVAGHDDGPDSLEMALRVMIQLHNGRATSGNTVRRLRP